VASESATFGNGVRRTAGLPRNCFFRPSSRRPGSGVSHAATRRGPAGRPDRPYFLACLLHRLRTTPVSLHSSLRASTNRTRVPRHRRFPRSVVERRVLLPRFAKVDRAASRRRMSVTRRARQRTLGPASHLSASSAVRPHLAHGAQRAAPTRCVRRTRGSVPTSEADPATISSTSSFELFVEAGPGTTTRSFSARDRSPVGLGPERRASVCLTSVIRLGAEFCDRVALVKPLAQPTRLDLIRARPRVPRYKIWIRTHLPHDAL
jgi:hypothetical protein